MSAMTFLMGLVLLMFVRHVEYISWQELTAQREMMLVQARRRFQELQTLLTEDLNKAAVKENAKHLKTSEENNEIDSTYNEIITLLMKRNGNFTLVKPVKRPEPLRTAISFSSMPHLMRSPRSTCPTFHVLSQRKGQDIDVVIGIPTVKRDSESYLTETITTLINGMTSEELKKTLIVVSVGEVDDLEYICNIAYELNSVFRTHYGELIEVISPSKHWYPDWDAVHPTLGDSLRRTLWRSKHNLDAVFLMSYAQTRGAFYLMLEDDLLAKKGYMTVILRFAANQTISNPQWRFISFSRAGGYGKYFRMEELVFFSAYLQIHYTRMPIDWLTELYLAERVCGLDKNSANCSRLKNSIRPTYKKSLFEHIGMYSSLRGKILKVKRRKRKSKRRVKLKNSYGKRKFTIKFVLMDWNQATVIKEMGSRPQNMEMDWPTELNNSDQKYTQKYIGISYTKGLAS